MIQVTDWSDRKRQIGIDFLQASPLPAEADPEIYAAILKRIHVTTRQDMRVLISFINDVIMEARREERPALPLEAFLDWLKYEQMYNEAIE